MRKLARYGWKKDIPDPRDHKWGAARPAAVAPPAAWDTRKYYPPIFDQGQTSSCTGQSAIAVAVHRRTLAGLLPVLMLSRLFAYYGGRAMGGDASQDDGAQIRDVMKFVNQSGVCREDVWPFDPSTITAQPAHQAYVAARWHRATRYRAVDQTLAALKAAVSTDDPFVFGFVVYDSFESDVVAKSGIMPMPGTTEGQVGGHAVCAAGYDDARKTFLVRNSWNSDWGQKGYFEMPYDFILSPDYCSDFWTVDMMNA